MDKRRTYIAIDLKSFYASVECVERGLNALTTNLVVADESRSDKTICLAVSPSLKSYGIPGRCRLFEVRQKVALINSAKGKINKKSWNNADLIANPRLKLDFLITPPQMALYIKYSQRIYGIYKRYISPDDIHVYSIDEVFIDATDYLKLYKKNAEEFARLLIKEVLSETGITATAGIGTNLYLAKIAMDIEAKHIKADEYGVRIASLDEKEYREKLWTHRPITDFWRVGRGIASTLERYNIFTMGDIARCSLAPDSAYKNEDLLYKLFGVNAELLIDHAWGIETCTMADIKSYKPEATSIGSGQVLQSPYSFDQARIVVLEMADSLALTLVEKNLKTKQIVLTIGYDIANVKDEIYQGDIKVDIYGRAIPKHAHGTANIDKYTSSSKKISKALEALYSEIVNRNLKIRRINLTATNVVFADNIPKEEEIKQLDLFTDYVKEKEIEYKQNIQEEKDESIQKALIEIKNKYGKNSILKGLSYEDGATQKERNTQIGGHKA